jgi:hypothetical protein
MSATQYAAALAKLEKELQAVKTENAVLKSSVERKNQEIQLLFNTNIKLQSRIGELESTLKINPVMPASEEDVQEYVRRWEAAKERRADVIKFMDAHKEKFIALAQKIGCTICTQKGPQVRFLYNALDQWVTCEECYKDLYVGLSPNGSPITTRGYDAIRRNEFVGENGMQRFKNKENVKKRIEAFRPQYK